MSSNLYSDYKYKRPKAPRKSFLFLIAIIIISVLMIIFIVNIVCLLFFSTKTESTSIQIPRTEFYASGINSITSKSKALEMAREVRNNGGAGFVSYNGSWFILTEVLMNPEEVLLSEENIKLKFSAESVTVNLMNAAHKEKFVVIIQSFEKNSQTLFSFKNKTSNETAACSLQLYNELSATVQEFDRFQENANSPVYSEVLIAAQKQLLALFLLSTEKDTENIDSALKHCICTIMFAYLDLLSAFTPNK